MNDNTATSMPSVLVAVPAHVLAEAEISENDVIQFRATEGKVMIEKLDSADDFVCDHDCEHCPLSEYPL